MKTTDIHIGDFVDVETDGHFVEGVITLSLPIIDVNPAHKWFDKYFWIVLLLDDGMTWGFYTYDGDRHLKGHAR